MRLTRHRDKWAVVVNGKRLSTGIEYGPENREAAERAARQISETFAQQIAGNTCAEIMDAWLADMPNRAQPKTPGDGTKYAVKAAKAFFGDHTPNQVTREECREYIKRLQEAGKSNGTIRKNLGALAAALRWKDPETPAVIELPPSAPPRDRWLTRQEVQALLDASEQSPHVETFIHIALATGGRKEAILQLRWDTHIDFERRTVWLGFKEGGKGRATVPMTNALYKALISAHEIALGDYVIEWAGKPIKDIRKALSRSYERASIEGVEAPAHVLRHTSGAYMAMEGVPLLEIATRLGHSSIETTKKHYAHLHPEFMSASTAALEI